MRQRILGVLAVLVFAQGMVVLADPPTLSIEQQATLVPGGVMVNVVVNCGDGESLGLVVVGVRQGNLSMDAPQSFASTGNRQEVSVFVDGPFTVGDASASAELACADHFAGEVLGATIKITQ